jgi:hypothetical protein
VVRPVEVLEFGLLPALPDTLTKGKSRYVSVFRGKYNSRLKYPSNASYKDMPVYSLSGSL